MIQEVFDVIVDLLSLISSENLRCQKMLKTVKTVCILSQFWCPDLVKKKKIPVVFCSRVLILLKFSGFTTDNCEEHLKFSELSQFKVKFRFISFFLLVAKNR